MNGTDVLRVLLSGSFSLVDARLEAVTDAEWRERVLRGTSKPGFILWHCARILDWTVCCAIQGAPEVADAPPWRDRFPGDALYGAGIPGSVADRIPEDVSSAEVAPYLGEVRDAALAWFDRQSEETLDAVPAMRDHQASHPGYLDPAVWAEVEDLNGLPAWQLLVRPCGAHIRRHMGEYDLLLGVMHDRVAAR